ncbi:unnamed protein product, partial [Protopolystoma xenopodis]
MARSITWFLLVNIIACVYLSVFASADFMDLLSESICAAHCFRDFVRTVSRIPFFSLTHRWA